MSDFVEQWEAALREAARPFAREDGKGEGPTFTLVLQVPGCLQGALHVEPPSEQAHVDRLAELTRALLACAPTGAASVRVVWKGLTRGPHEGAAAHGVTTSLEELPSLRAVTNLHIGQSLEAAQKLSEESVMAVCEQMRSIFELARSHSDGLEKVASQFSAEADKSNDQNIGSTIQQLAEKLKGFGQELVDRTNRQARDIEQARAWTNDIVKLGQSIAAIASNARILTFNARLESARIGEAGRGFAVIAGSIQDLATQVRQANQSVSELATNLLQTLPRLGADAAETSRSSKEAVAALEERLWTVQQQLGEVRIASYDALTASTGAARELQEKANSVIGHLQFQDRASQMMEEVAAQTRALMDAAGVAEKPVDPSLIEQVGALGRTLAPSDDTRPPGSLELF